MASKAVVDAFAAQIAAVWSNTPIIGPNSTATPPSDGSPFLIYEFPVAREDQISLGAPGARVFREEGAVRLVLLAPIGVGLDPYQGWMDALRASFRGVKFSGVNTWAPGPPIINEESSRGSYFEISTAIPFYIDVLG